MYNYVQLRLMIYDIEDIILMLILIYQLILRLIIQALIPVASTASFMTRS